jgi:hypothetical protein
MSRSSGAAGGVWKLYDQDAVYTSAAGNGVKSNSDALEFIVSEIHDAGVTPVVRYLDEYDLDATTTSSSTRRSSGGMRVPMRGQIAPLMTLQDQIDVTTFGLLVAQWWGAFRQRYVIGWTAPSERAHQGEHGAADDVRGSAGRERRGRHQGRRVRPDDSSTATSRAARRR